MRFTVPAVRAVQSGHELFLFFLSAKTLQDLPITVERFDPDKPYDDPDQGYQRAAEKNRARRFARYLKKADAMSPTTLMLNDRDSITNTTRRIANWFSTPPRGRSLITTGSTASSATASGWATIRPSAGSTSQL